MVATTGGIDLSSVTSIDGVTLADNDRVLVKDQNTASEHGIYVFTLSTTSLARADDMPAGSNAASNILLLLKKVAANGDKGFVCTSDSGF